MKKLISLLLSALLLLSLTACSIKPAAGWQEQYDSGIKFVKEAKYEEAIISFTKALKIDPKQPQAYVSLAQVYMTQNMPIQAQAVLDSGFANTKADEIRQAYIDLNFTPPAKTETEEKSNGRYYIYSYDEDGNILRITKYDADGNVTSYEIYEYDRDGNKISCTSCDSTGLITYYETYRYEFYPDGTVKTEFISYYPEYPEQEVCLFFRTYDENGQLVWMNNSSSASYDAEIIVNDASAPAPYGIKSIDDDGRWSIIQFNENGDYLSEAYYMEDGRQTTTLTYEYDENGNNIRTNSYNSDGVLYSYAIHTYDENGNRTDTQHFQVN